MAGCPAEGREISATSTCFPEDRTVTPNQALTEAKATLPRQVLLHSAWPWSNPAGEKFQTSSETPAKKHQSHTFTPRGNPMVSMPASALQVCTVEGRTEPDHRSSCQQWYRPQVDTQGPHAKLHHPGVKMEMRNVKHCSLSWINHFALKTLSRAGCSVKKIFLTPLSLRFSTTIDL